MRVWKVRKVIDLRLGRWQDVLNDVHGVDALIVDAPYSVKTHKGHDYTHSVARGDVKRKKLGYGAFGEKDVVRFVRCWDAATRGWFVTITDDVLAPIWQRALEEAGRYVFAPLPFVAPGSRVRLAGDGPSSWTCWIVVARPRSKKFSTWGTLPGAYVLPSGEGGAMPIVGGKPLWLMRALVRDYSRPGDLVVDPCAGAATTLLAAAIEGRRAIGAEVDPATHAVAVERIAKGYTPTLFDTNQPRRTEQLGLLAETPEDK